MDNNAAVWTIAGLATFVRPFRVAEFVWAMLGATALVAFGLLPGGKRLLQPEKAPTSIFFSSA